jgi:cell wall-associated NlpC family hydrolase
MMKAALSVLIPLCLLLSACSPAVRFTRPGDVSEPPMPKSKGAHRAEWLSVDEQRMMDVINRLKGVPYLWGGLTEKGMDCSGFVMAVFWKAEKIQLPHNSREMASYGVGVSRAALRVGDLVFFKIHSYRINHVGIYVGEGRFAHASWIGGVTITNLDDPYYRDKYAKAKRLFTE